MVKILRFYSKTGGTDLISGQDTKTPYAVQHNRGKKKKKKKHRTAEHVLQEH